jgi:hypothetical protein
MATALAKQGALVFGPGPRGWTFDTINIQGTYIVVGYDPAGIWTLRKGNVYA